MVSGVKKADYEILKPNPPAAENLKPFVSNNMLPDKARQGPIATQMIF